MIGSFSALERFFLKRKERLKSNISALEQGGQLVGGERGFLTGSLNLDVLAVARLDDVHVNIGVGIKHIIEVKIDVAVDQTNRNRCQVVRDDRVLVVLSLEGIQGWWRPALLSLFRGWSEVNGEADALSDESADSQTQGDVGRRDGGAPGAAVSVQDVAVHVERNGSKRLQIHGGTKGTSDETLDFLCSTFGATALTAEARIGGTGEQGILSVNPAFGGITREPTGEAGFFGAAGQDHGVALLVQHRSKGVGGEVQCHFGCSHFVVGSRKVEFSFEFRHGPGYGAGFIKPSQAPNGSTGRLKVCLQFHLTMPQPQAVICAVARTPIGKFMGAYTSMTAVDLGVLTVKELLTRANVDPSSGVIDEVLFGQVLQAGAGQNPARQVALGAGLPVSTPAATINKVCGSSLKAAMMAANSIRAGEYKAIIAGGMESMSNAPQLLMGQRKGAKMGNSTLVDSMIHDGLWDVYNDVHMGTTGETVAKECNINRATMDAFAARSQQRASEAWANGWFDWETFPVEIPQRRGDPTVLSTDEGVRGQTTIESLAGLRPVFDREGAVTAGNASTLNDGASAVLIAEAEFAKAQGWEVIATIEDYCTSGVEPARVMSAPIPAVKSLLERNNLDVLDVDVYEHNEAFASASCAVAQEVGIPDDRFNLHGGAVSVGHPLGASGTRCLITMLGVMRRLKANSGIVTLCLGGGNAVAMYVRSSE